MPTVKERCKILRSLNRVYVFGIVLLLVPRLKILRRRGLSYLGIFEKQRGKIEFPRNKPEHQQKGFKGGLAWIKPSKNDMAVTVSYSRCPRNSDLSHVTQDTPCACFRGVGAHCAGFWGFLAPFWAVSRTYRGTKRH